MVAERVPDADVCPVGLLDGLLRDLDAGVEITQEPVEQPYGTDIGVRDPFGNHVRISQPGA